jgi:5-methylcytosine-specific restriction endonuclease McrA
MTCAFEKCSKEFEPPTVDRPKRYCSTKCKGADHYKRNRKERLAQIAAYNAAHREELVEKRAANKKEIAAKDAAYRAAHQKEIAAQRADYYAAHRDEIAVKRAAHRAKCIAYLGGKCVRCGATDELDFDHVNSATKSFSIGKRLGHGWTIIGPELRLCQLLCRGCHILKTARENPQRPQIAKALRMSSRGGSHRAEYLAV